MDHWDSEPDGTERTPLTDLAVLWTARDPEELWRALVVSAGRSTTHRWEAVALFRHHHGRLSRRAHLGPAPVHRSAMAPLYREARRRDRRTLRPRRGRTRRTRLPLLGVPHRSPPVPRELDRYGMGEHRPER